MIGPEGFRFFCSSFFWLPYCLDPPYMKFHFSDGCFLVFSLIEPSLLEPPAPVLSLALFLHFRVFLAAGPCASHSRCSLVPFLHFRNSRSLALPPPFRCSPPGPVPSLPEFPVLPPASPLLVLSVPVPPLLEFPVSGSAPPLPEFSVSVSPLRSFLFLVLRLHLRSSVSVPPLSLSSLLPSSGFFSVSSPSFSPSSPSGFPLPSSSCPPFPGCIFLPLPVFHLQPPALPHCRKFFSWSSKNAAGSCLLRRNPPRFLFFLLISP